MKLSENISDLRNFAQIDLGALIHNYKLIRSFLPDAASGICAVVKADAYGHGAAECARALEPYVDYFACADFYEAAALRENGIYSPILLLGVTPVSHARAMATLGITQTVPSLEYARELSEALSQEDILKVHLKLDTGMSRLGFLPSAENFISLVSSAVSLKNLDFEGVFTHLADADDLFSEFTGVQLSMFYSALSSLWKAGIKFKYRHFANSAACCRHLSEMYEHNFPGASYGSLLFRPGIMLYGSYPSADIKALVERADCSLKPVMSLCARVVRIHEIKSGESVGYNRTFCARRDSRIAVIAAGYADGIPRAFSNRVSLISPECRVTGNVCMDMLFLDITDMKSPPNEGDFVTLFGPGSDISADRLSYECGTISYELFCRVSARVKRIYTPAT